MLAPLTGFKVVFKVFSLPIQKSVISTSKSKFSYLQQHEEM